MRIVNTEGATVLNHDGTDYESAHGVFDVPEHVGQALIGFPHWLHEHEAVDRAATAKAEADTDPARLAARVAELEAARAAGAADLAARIAQLEAENATLKAAAADAAPTEAPVGEPPAKAPKPPKPAKAAAEAPADPGA